MKNRAKVSRTLLGLSNIFPVCFAFLHFRTTNEVFEYSVRKIKRRVAESVEKLAEVVWLQDCSNTFEDDVSGMLLSSLFPDPIGDCPHFWSSTIA